MLSDAEFDWIEEQLTGDYDHLLIGTSLPWLLPRAFHDIEAWNELLCDGHRGRAIAAVSEKIRRAGDFEHWAAFRESFERLALLIRDVGKGDYAADSGSAPATVCVLSGDVHHAYIARPDYGDEVTSAVFQLTCSPLHNHVPVAVQLAFRAAWSRFAERTTRVVLGIVARVPKPIVEWTRIDGPVLRQRPDDAAAGRPTGGRGAGTGRPVDGARPAGRGHQAPVVLTAGPAVPYRPPERRYSAVIGG